MAKKLPKTRQGKDVQYFARILPQDLRATPPRKALNRRMYERTMVAGGKWHGPFTKVQADEMREMREAGCDLTFQVLDADGVREVQAKAEAAQGKDQSPAVAELQRQLDQQQVTLDRVLKLLEAKNAPAKEPTAEGAGEASGEEDFGDDPETEGAGRAEGDAGDGEPKAEGEPGADEAEPTAEGAPGDGEPTGEAGDGQDNVPDDLKGAVAGEGGEKASATGKGSGKAAKGGRGRKGSDGKRSFKAGTKGPDEE